MELSSSPGSSKKVKAFGSMAHVVSCLVDGCNSDLSRCRNYHRRHKVCEIHSKTPKATIRGQEQRFCQQCSRFHSLIEFDEEKRSCRKRLDGHNRRRRKPQADSLHRTSDIFHSNHPGSRLLSFSNPQILLTATENCTWTKNVKTEDDILPSNLNYTDIHNLFTRSSAQNYKARPQFSQITDNIPPVTSFGQQFPEPHSTHCISQKELSHHLTLAGNSNGAYSLLSSESTETSEAGSSHMVRPNHFPLSQSLLQNLHFSGLDHYHFTRRSKPSQ